MRYGVCGNPELASTAAVAGFDYFEWSVGEYLKPQQDSEAFAEAQTAVKGAPLSCPVVNCFVPGSLKITGPEADLAALESYVGETCRRAQLAEVNTIVFGSGGARQIPEGFDRSKAHDQLVTFCKMTGPIAQEHGVTIAVEPLNLSECNVLTTVQESADYVREVNHPGIRLLADAYHMLKDNDPWESITKNVDILTHVHVATIPNRLPPGIEECELSGFFEALIKGGYDGLISIEGDIPDPENDLPKALNVMKSLEEAAREMHSRSGA